MSGPGSLASNVAFRAQAEQDGARKETRSLWGVLPENVPRHRDAQDA